MPFRRKSYFFFEKLLFLQQFCSFSNFKFFWLYLQKPWILVENRHFYEIMPCYKHFTAKLSLSPILNQIKFFLKKKLFFQSNLNFVRIWKILQFHLHSTAFLAIKNFQVQDRAIFREIVQLLIKRKKNACSERKTFFPYYEYGGK